jgi:hypothetical protein
MLGPEFQVNTYTTGPQRASGVAVHGEGSFVIVWDSGLDYSTEPDGDDGIGVFMQRFDAGGARIGVEQHVNTFTTSSQTGPVVSSLADGAFVVAWTSGCYYGGSECGPDGASTGVSLRRFDAAGVPAGSELVVNTFTPGGQFGAEVAASPSGDFVVVWGSSTYQDPQPDRDVVGVFAQRFSAAGTPVGGEMPVNVFTIGRQGAAAVAMDAGGSFLVVWGSDNDYDVSIRAQGFGADGTPLGEFEVSSDAQYASSPAVTATRAGEFVIAWEVSSSAFDGADEIRARRFAAGGTALGPEFLVNTYGPGHQRRPALAADAAGNFVVSWMSTDEYADPTSERDPHGIFGQAFAADGAPLGSEFQVNASDGGRQVAPEVGGGGAGRFVVAWTSLPGSSGSPPQDGDSSGAFARQVSLRPCTASGECDDANPCTTDACESGVCLNRRHADCCRKATDCDDREPCTDDVCSAGSCSHVPVEDCTLCSHLIPCFIGPKPCTTVACNEVLSRCEFIPIEGCCLAASDCDDGLACTVDTCSEEHACGAIPIADCLDCSTDADCAAGCLVAPETCVAGRCETPAVCPIVTLDDPDPIGRSGKLLVRVDVPADVPGSGKVKAIATGAIGTRDAGDGSSRACREGAIVARARTEVTPGGGSNLRLALTKPGARCLAADPDGVLPVDVQVRVKRKKTGLAEVAVPRVWRR